MTVPKFYLKLLEEDDKYLFDVEKARKFVKGMSHEEDRSIERLKVRERVQIKKMEFLNRSYENGV